MACPVSVPTLSILGCRITWRSNTSLPAGISSTAWNWNQIDTLLSYRTVFWLAQTLLFQLCCTVTESSYQWFDLQMSVSTVSTKHFARSETPSSILSSDSDIRFTRKLGAHYRCGCCILAGFLLFMLLAAAAVYLGRKYEGCSLTF